MRIGGGGALVLLCAAVCPLLLEGRTRCQVGPQIGYVRGGCPLNLTSVQSHKVEYHTVTLRVLMPADDLCSSPTIEIRGKETLRPTLKKTLCNTQVNHQGRKRGSRGSRVVCDSNVRNISSALWELLHISTFGVGTRVSVFYSGKSTNCSVTHTVPDPVPAFEVSANLSSKSFTVTVAPGHTVLARWCYMNRGECGDSNSTLITIDPAVSPSATLSFPHLLPCVCVQVYHTFRDAIRHVRCPFRSNGIVDAQDVWRSSEFTRYESKLVGSLRCPASELNVSAALCWSQRGRCTPAANSTLERRDGPPLEFNTSTVDVHPQTCVQFSVNGSRMTYCPFTSDAPSWEASVGAGGHGVVVTVTSSVPARFSAQPCVLSEGGCTPAGPVQSLTLEEKVSGRSLNVPVPFFAPNLCVQVWQSDPALQGRRIICPNVAHSRKGIYAVAAVLFAIGAVLLGVAVRGAAKRGAAGWLYFQRPLLLVCSSDRASHVSAVCALASILREELGSPVRTSLWAQSSHGEAGEAGSGAGAGVANLGPLPWLYGQWEAVCEAQGKVLIVWSPEAKRTFEKWWEQRTDGDKDGKKQEDHGKACRRHEKTGTKPEVKLGGRRLGRCRKEKPAERRGCSDPEEQRPQEEPSAVIEPVFTAALACLEGALQTRKGQVAAIVYFQGLAHGRDVPKALRSVARYCLPQDFRGLIQELGGVRKRTEAGRLRWRCWPRLLTKALSMWLARQLARRLRTALPRAPATSDETAGRLGLQPAAEREPLCTSPWRAEEP